MTARSTNWRGTLPTGTTTRRRKTHARRPPRSTLFPSTTIFRSAGTALTSATLGGNQRVYYQADDRQVHELAWDPPNWHHNAAAKDARAPTAEIYTLSLHDDLPLCRDRPDVGDAGWQPARLLSGR